MALLLLYALLLFVEHWRWITAAIAGAILLRAGLRQRRARKLARRQTAIREHARMRGLVERADQQHAWSLDGDQRGTYGRYPPARTEGRSA